MPKSRPSRVRSESKRSRPQARERRKEQQTPARKTNGVRSAAKSRSQPAGNSRGGSRVRSRARPAPRTLDIQDTLTARELFWANVVREILCSLAEASQQAAGTRLAGPGPAEGDSGESRGALMAPPGPGGTPAPGADGVGEPPMGPPDVLDGRICIITTFGERIPIAEVKPLFAMGVDQSPETRALSMAVECSVFQVRSPKGMVYTLPIHEIRAVRAVSEELMMEIERERENSGPANPFGFAAFTSLARSGLPGGDVRLPAADEETYWE